MESRPKPGDHGRRATREGREMTKVTMHVDGNAEAVSSLANTLEFVKGIGAPSPDIQLSQFDNDGNGYLTLECPSNDYALMLIDNIKGFDPTLRAHRVAKESIRTPLGISPEEARQARQSQGIMVHLPEGPEYLQHTLITGTRASGKTQTLLRAMINVSANPHSIL